MARSSGRASNARKVGRPALGNNSTRPLNSPRPAYAKPYTPTVVSQGSVSRPRDTRWSGPALKTLVADRPPKVIQL